MTNDQVNASRYVALRNADCVFQVGASSIVVSCDGSSETVSFTRDTPAETLERELRIAAAKVSNG